MNLRCLLIPMLPDPVHGFRTREKLTDLPRAIDWTETDLGPVNRKEGDNHIQFCSGGHGRIAADYFRLEQLD
jgi:hypothetical protein